MSDAPAEYVTRTPDGSWRVAGTRVSLASVAHAYRDGRLPEAIVADFPALTLEQVYGAIAFYLRHQPEIDRHLGELDAAWDRFRAASATRHAPLLSRIRQAAGNPAAPGPQL